MVDHNRRSVCTIVEVDGKIERQWDGMTLEEFSKHPYTFFVKEQKFVLSWIVQTEEADAEDCFELQASG